MRITTVLLITAIMQVNAASYGQRITLNQNHASIERIFLEIRKQSGYDFVFDNKMMKRANPVNIRVKNASIEETLKLCFENQPFEYTLDDKTIVVKEKEKSVLSRISEFFSRITVAGKVVDTQGRILSGITVTVKGTDKVTLTNLTGTFILAEVDEDATLVFTSVSKETLELKLKGKRTVEVILKDKTMELQEVVVNTGYQVLKKTDVVGSTATINAKELYLNGVNTIEQALQGKLTGVVVTNTSGLTGTRQTVRVRGTSTLAGNQEPIWVVDGVIQEDPLPFKAQTLNNVGQINSDNFDFIRNFVGNSIRWLNPNDIEDITVLKDASATAIYGIRAGNGVIVITTKKGQVGPPVVSYSTNLSTTERVNYDRLNLMNSKERVAVSREIFARGLTAPFVNSTIGYAGALNEYLYKKTISADEFNARVTAMETVNTDWFDLLFRTPFSMSHNLGISGGNTNTRYYSSFGYSANNGTAIGNDTRGITGNVSVSSQLSKRINMNLRLSGAQNTTNGFYIINPYSYTTKTNRAIPAYQGNGDLNYYLNSSSFMFNFINERDETGNKNKTLSANGSIDVNYQVIEGLRLQTLFSYNAIATNAEAYATERTEYMTRLRGFELGLKPNDPLYIASRIPVGGEYNGSSSNSSTWNWRNSLSYNRIFEKKHTIALMFGHEMSSVRYDGSQSTVYGYLRDRGKSFATLPLTYGTSKFVNTLLNVIPTITDRRSNNMGLYFTSSYSYDNRYVLNMSIRNDRSNRFGQFTNEKFNPVWAGGLRWNVANEAWFNRSNWLNNLSMRASFGYQRNIAANASPDLIIKIPTGSSSNSTDPVTGDALLAIGSLPYADLRWEQNASLNLGIDWSLFENKIHVSVEYYNKRGRQLITTLNVPLEYGVTSMLVNGGSLNNTGYEVSAGFVPVRTKNFTWSVNLNTSKNNNKVIKVGPQVVSWQTAASGNLYVQGKPVSGFYAFRSEGVNPTNGEPIINLGTEEGDDLKNPTSFMQYMGKLDPDFTSGLGLNFRYKMLSLSSSFYLQVGGKKFLAPLYNYEVGKAGLPTEYENLSRLILDRWTATNTTSNIPALPNGRLPNVTLPNGDPTNNNLWTLYNYSTARVVSASSLRCNNVNLSYSLPANVVKRLKCKNIHLGAGVSNPFSINSSGFRGIDAEVATGGQPRTRTYTFNLNLSL